MSLHLSKCHIVGNHMSRLILSIVTAYHHDDKQYDANDEVTELLKYTYWFTEIAIKYVYYYLFAYFFSNMVFGQIPH